MAFPFSTQIMASVSQLIGGGQPAASDPLTGRQREVLRMIAEGHNIKAIAKSLAVSPKTVESHRSAIKVRLGINNIPGLVRYAMRVGLVGLET
jgi:DNA-binding NarL/FixJ family response regulator